jgi:hypothetical protein
MRLVVLALLTCAASAAAQNTKAPAPQQTKQSGTAPATKTDAKTAPGTKQDTKAGATKTDTKAPGRTALAIAPETAPRVAVPPIMREAYDYDAGGRRDPFFSLLGTDELRPTVADLKLTGVLYHPTRPIAVMRDTKTNTQYRVTVGTQLGRMRVILIRPRVVIFTIEEFGVNRQDSLFLGDTSKVRAR